jgi:Phosphate-selective porin O and P
VKAPRLSMFAAAAVAAFLLCGALPAHAQWQIESKDGKSNIKFGFLAQPQFEGLQTTDPTSAGGTVYAKNIFLRRFRIVFGGQIAGNWTFFFETDSPNLGKQVAGTTAKDTGFIFIQDAFLTYNHGDAFKIDTGLILLGLDHNHLQSAATLLPVDYSPYTFNESTPLQERVGRDYGVEARGYPFKQHLEYRLGVFQGIRGAESRNGLRVAGRAVWYPFAADTGFFYAGTFQGTKRVVGLGASFDTQNAPTPVAPATARNRYRSYGLDAFVEQPIHKGREGVTGQFDWLRFDGGTLAPTLQKQDTYLVEAGVHFGGGHFSPFVQYATRAFVGQPTLADTSYWQAGFAWWMAGHQRNLKFSGGRSHTDAVGTSAAIDRNQFLVQLQIFAY